jgi:hypothetical protein
MCGIVGVVSKHIRGLNRPELEAFEELLKADAIRGNDSTGMFAVTQKNQVPVLKQATHPEIFCATKAYNTFLEDVFQKGHVLIGHNRKATVGDITSKNAHPFFDKKIALVHNGYIGNAKHLDESVAVDSQAIITALSTENDVVKGLQKLWGAWAIVWYNHETKKLYLARNNDRPLAVAHTVNHMYLASESDMLKWILTRNKVSFSEPQELASNSVLEISFNPFAVKEFKVPVKEYNVTHVPARRLPVYMDTSAMDPDYDVAFELEDRDSQTELGRARQLAQAAANGGHVSNYGGKIQDLMKRYPAQTYALFWPKQFVEDKGTGIVNVWGMVWAPHKIPCPAVVSLRAEDEDECYLDPRVPLLGQIHGISRRNDDIRIVLSSIKAASSVVKDINGTELSHEEWQMICRFKGCDSCAKALLTQQLDVTQIKKIGQYEYEVTCSECLFKDDGASRSQGG